MSIRNLVNAMTGEVILRNVTDTQIDRWYDSHSMRFRRPECDAEILPELREDFGDPHGDEYVVEN